MPGRGPRPRVIGDAERRVDLHRAEIAWTEYADLATGVGFRDGIAEGRAWRRAGAVRAGVAAGAGHPGPVFWAWAGDACMQTASSSASVVDSANVFMGSPLDVCRVTLMRTTRHPSHEPRENNKIPSAHGAKKPRA